MGSPVPLGYDLRDKKLFINHEEAKTIHWIFHQFLSIGSVAELKREVDLRGITSKVRFRRDGQKYGGKPISRGNIYLILKNPIYAGFIDHKGELYPGQHEAIIEQDIWDAVQTKLYASGTASKQISRTKDTYLLSGLVFDATGDRLIGVKTTKKGVIYRYYVSSRLCSQKRADENAIRVSATKLEDKVIASTADFLRNPKILSRLCG